MLNQGRLSVTDFSWSESRGRVLRGLSLYLRPVGKTDFTQKYKQQKGSTMFPLYNEVLTSEEASLITLVLSLLETCALAHV